MKICINKIRNDIDEKWNSLINLDTGPMQMVSNQQKCVIFEDKDNNLRVKILEICWKNKNLEFNNELGLKDLWRLLSFFETNYGKIAQKIVVYFIYQNLLVNNGEKCQKKRNRNIINYTSKIKNVMKQNVCNSSNKVFGLMKMVKRRLMINIFKNKKLKILLDKINSKVLK